MTSDHTVRGLGAFLFLLVGVAAASAQSAGPRQLHVITSGAFAGPLQQILPEFERTTGIIVTTQSGASQGTGADTIGAMLRREVHADLVIMSREGLNDLVREGRIVPGSDVNLAQIPTGLAVRAGARKPDIGTLQAFQSALLGAKAIAVPGSTTGIDLINRVFPQLHVDPAVVRLTARGAEAVALVAKGDADFAIQPMSELIQAPGVELVGPIPEAAQFAAVFSAAIISGAAHIDAAKQLIAALVSESAAEPMRRYGMRPLRPAR